MCFFLNKKESVIEGRGGGVVVLINVSDINKACEILGLLYAFMPTRLEKFGYLSHPWQPQYAKQLFLPFYENGTI